MKKVFKSRIFIVIITMIICISGTLYATNTYQAREISYNPSNGEPTNVNDALNELYNDVKKNEIKCEKDSFCSKVKLGDYVQMTPTSTSYTISTSLTGYSVDQTINPSELNLWRIIKINENGTIEMVSANVSSTNVTFYGQTGYLNFVGALNTIASQYGNSNYSIGSRIIGYGGQTEYLTDTSIFSRSGPWTVGTSDNSNETLGGGDYMYISDVDLLKKALGTLKATNPSGTATSYHLGSRYYRYMNTTYFDFNVRYVVTNGYIDGFALWRYNKDISIGKSSLAIRPILTLKSGLTATGSGTSEDPWVLQ